MPTYDPEKTPHIEAARRCGLVLKKRGTINVAMVDSDGRPVFEGSRESSWEYMRDKCGLMARKEE